MSGPKTPRDELAEATAHGGLYLRRLIRRQLGLSVLTLIAFGGFLALIGRIRRERGRPSVMAEGLA